MRILLAANVVLAVLGIAFILAGRAGRERAQRPPTYAEAMAQMVVAFQEIQIALGEAMLPAVRRANEAFKRFGEAMKRDEEDS